MGLTPRSENSYTPQQPGFAESAGAPLLQEFSIIFLFIASLLGALNTASTAGLPLLLQLLRSS